MVVSRTVLRSGIPYDKGNKWINEHKIYFTSDEIRRIMTYQKQQCPICKRKLWASNACPEGYEKGDWDHQHFGMRYVRGYLCHVCNVSLGNLELGKINAFDDGKLYLWADKYLAEPTCFKLGIYVVYPYNDYSTYKEVA